MIGRVVEIAEDGRHLALHRGFLVVKADGAELGRVPLDDIAVVIANAHGLTYSNNLLLALAERNIGLVMCGPNHVPAALLWPVQGHHAQTRRMRAQAEAGKPLVKQLWQALVRAKIRHQGAVLANLGRPAGGFERLERLVRSGDPENVEAQAARRYWPLLFASLVDGGEFRRDPEEPGINGLLNYGYAILRSATARAVTAAGLHPTLGLHHSNRGNPLCLVDDVMEPFRPLVDLAVVRLVEAGQRAVDIVAKRRLAGLPESDLATRQGTTPLSTCLYRLASSLGQAYEQGEPVLELPLSPLPAWSSEGAATNGEANDGA